MKIKFVKDFNKVKAGTEVTIADHYGKELIEKKVAEKADGKKADGKKADSKDADESKE